MQNILAAIDFSPVVTPLVEAAAKLAKAFSAKLWLVHVAAPDPDFVGYSAGPQTVRDQVASRLHEEHRQLQAQAEALRQRQIEVTPLLVQGQTVPSILQEAQRVGADVIVLGSHGHGALYRAMVGSVAEGVLRKAPCPVLVIPRVSS